MSVTGGCSGIGLGAAKAFSAEGARVFITGRNQVALDKAVAEMAKRAARIDVLMLNAGIFEPMAIGEITEEHFDKIYNTNVRGLLFGFQKALPFFAESALTILTGSIGATIGIPGMSVYGSPLTIPKETYDA